jgi:parallel beta-helix repeat protein
MLSAGSDNTLAYNRARDQADGIYLDASATVIADVLGSAGTPITGGANIACAYVAGTHGTFRGNLPNTAALVKGSTYTVRFTITHSVYKRIHEITEVCE